MRSTKLLPLEFRVFRRLQAWLEEREPSAAKILVACSGGLDSVVLASCLARISGRLELPLVVGHVHHGLSEIPAVVQARLAAFRKTKQIAGAFGLPFLAAKPSQQKAVLVSEEALRNHRLRSLEWMRERTSCTHIAFGHHRDDLFETRLIRLIRGTGPQGLKAMQEFSGGVLRPLLNESREEIRRYALARNLTWLEDPTNSDSDYLRNWLRHIWLPQLEEKRVGSTRSFARSLENLVDAWPEKIVARRDDFAQTANSGFNQSFDRRRYSGLDKSEKRRELAAFLLALNAKEFSTRHIEEILKRLQTPRRQFSFRLLKMDWEVNAQQVSVRRRAT